MGPAAACRRRCLFSMTVARAARLMRTEQRLCETLFMVCFGQQLFVTFSFRSLAAACGRTGVNSESVIWNCVYFCSIINNKVSVKTREKNFPFNLSRLLPKLYVMCLYTVTNLAAQSQCLAFNTRMMVQTNTKASQAVLLHIRHEVLTGSFVDYFSTNDQRRC